MEEQFEKLSIKNTWECGCKVIKPNAHGWKRIMPCDEKKTKVKCERLSRVNGAKRSKSPISGYFTEEQMEIDRQRAEDFNSKPEKTTIKSKKRICECTECKGSCEIITQWGRSLTREDPGTKIENCWYCKCKYSK